MIDQDTTETPTEEIVVQGMDYWKSDMKLNALRLASDIGRERPESSESTIKRAQLFYEWLVGEYDVC